MGEFLGALAGGGMLLLVGLLILRFLREIGAMRAEVCRAILRTAEALGTDALYLYQCVDLYNPKTIRSSMGAMFRLPLMRLTDMDAFFAHCKEVSLPTCAAVVDRDAAPLGGYDFCRGAVVLIGNEGNGLPKEVSGACDKRLTIPMSPASNSLNAAMAAGLFLWEMAKS